MFLVRREGRPERFALKIHTGARDRETLIRLQLEAEVVGRLDHPGIVKVRDHGVIDGRDYLLLDYCEGESLQERLRRGPLPWPEAGALMLELSRTMASAHAQGVLHRDLKPGNVIVETSTGLPKLIDFGLARDRSLVQSLTQSRVAMGTPVAMAPEQLRAAKDVDARADVYALGVLLYWCLTGRAPFQAVSLVELEQLVLKVEPEPPSRLAPDVPAALERLCLRALAKHRGDRPGDAGAFADELEAALADDAVVRGRPAAHAASRLATALTLTILALSVGVAGAIVWRGGAPADASDVESSQDAGPTAETEALLAELRRREHASAPLGELRALLDRAEVVAAADPALVARVQLARGDACRRRGDYQSAIEAAPVDAEGRVGLMARWLQGLCYLRTGRGEQADAIWRALVADDPDGVSGLDAQAILMIRDGDDLWPTVAQRCEAADPTNFHARVVGAYGRWRLQGAEAALNDLAALERDEPDDPHVPFVRAFVLSGEQDLPGARAAYSEVLRRTAPFASVQALEGRAFAWVREQAWDAAIEDYDRLLELYPRHVAAWLVRGFCHQALGRREQALQDWREACRVRDPATWEDELRVLPPDFIEGIQGLARDIPPEVERPR